PHGFHGLVHIADKSFEGVAGALNRAGLHPLGEGFRLVAQFRLHGGKERRVFGIAALGAGALELVPGGGDDFFLALRDLALLFALAAAATTAAIVLLGLGVVALEGLGLNEEDIGAAGGARILGGGVQADDVARLHFEILQRNHGSTGGIPGVLGRQQGNGFFGAAIHGVVQGDVAQREIVFC